MGRVPEPTRKWFLVTGACPPPPPPFPSPPPSAEACVQVHIRHARSSFQKLYAGVPPPSDSARAHAKTHAHAHTHKRTSTHAHAHAHVRKRTNADASMWSHTRRQWGWFCANRLTIRTTSFGGESKAPLLVPSPKSVFDFFLPIRRGLSRVLTDKKKRT